jgi:hypothetical protein
MTKKSRSTYILCTPWDRPTEIDIHNWKGGVLFLNYWVRAFQEFDKISRLEGLTIYLVWNHMLVPELPSYGKNVVAVLATDEECVIPRYLNKVRFVFKSYGFQPWCGDSIRDPSPASVLKCARDWALWAYHLALFARENQFSLTQGGKMVIPFGYAQQTDVPVKPIETRRYLVGFLGSIENKTYPAFSPKRLVGTPKQIARSRMAESMRKLAESAPESVFFGTTASFTESVTGGTGARYSEIMADTKIALAPRGSSVQTYRFFEAMRQRLHRHLRPNAPALVLSRFPGDSDRRLAQSGGGSESFVRRPGTCGASASGNAGLVGHKTVGTGARRRLPQMS